MSLSPEYRQYINSKSWRSKRPFIMALTLGRDSILPIFPAHDCDHLTYKNLGRELPLRDCVPLHRFTHRNVITPARSVLRKILGRSLGNFVAAWFLRGCVIWWWSIPVRLMLAFWRTING
jgi:hypothetical protein